MSTRPSTASGRFEQSFIFHMIKDFFLLLVAVAAVEMAVRYAALRCAGNSTKASRCAWRALRSSWLTT